MSKELFVELVLRLEETVIGVMGSFNNTQQNCKPYVLTADHCAYDDDNNSYASSNDESMDFLF